MHLSIRQQIVGPFVILVLFVGIVGTAVVSTQFAGATAAGLDATLLRAGFLASDHLELVEADRTKLLRAFSNTVGVPEALSSHDSQTLEKLLTPVLANEESAQLALRVLDRQAQPVLGLKQATESGATRLSDGVDYSGQVAVTEVLAGRSDGLGDKYLFVATEVGGPVVYWVGPVRGDGQAVVGAVLLGEPLSQIAAGIRGLGGNEVIFYDFAGNVLNSSLPVAPLKPEVKQAVTIDHPVRSVETVGDHRYGLLVSDWEMRGRRLGYFAVALNADHIADSLAQLRLFLVILFAAATLAALLVGITLAYRITSPLESLVGSMEAVSAGNLRRRVRSVARDELGFLSRTFNVMTASLEEKSKQIEEAYFTSLAALARAIDSRDPYTFEQSARVAAISLEIADEMGLSQEDRNTLRRSALLHDIGRIGIDDRILGESGPLSNEDWEVIRRHPVLGYDILKDVPFLAASLPGVRHHHERWDGTGYPSGLKGDQIPMLVRILSLADAFDSMTSDRAHRKAFSFEFATKAVTAAAGSQFDPAVVKAFEARQKAIIEKLTMMGKVPAPQPAEIEWFEEAG